MCNYYIFLSRRETSTHDGYRRTGRPTTTALSKLFHGGLVVGHGREIVRRRRRRRRCRPRVQVLILRQAVRHELEPEDALARAHGRETVRVPAVCGHVQAKGAPAQASVLRAQERHIARHQCGRPGDGGLVQLLLLSDAVRHAPAVGPSLLRAAQQLVANQELERLTLSSPHIPFSVENSRSPRTLDGHNAYAHPRRCTNPSPELHLPTIPTLAMILFRFPIFVYNIYLFNIIIHYIL